MYLAHHLKKRQTEVILKANHTITIEANHFYYECFLQYFEGCPRVSSFHLSNLDNEVVPMSSLQLQIRLKVS